jgi:hypothetical protein
MWTLALLLAGFLVVAVALAALALYLNEFEKKVDSFCEVIRERYRPGFQTELEEKAAKQIEQLAKTLKS